MASASETVIRLYREKMQDLRRRIVASVEQLGDDDINWRPNDESNSIANIVLHLDGNIGQRVVTGIGGAPDRRDRDAEFNARERMTRAQVLDRAEAMFAAAEQATAGITPDRLQDPAGEHRGQTLTVLDVLWKTATHTDEHVGQILYIVKQRLGPNYRPLSLPHKKA